MATIASLAIDLTANSAKMLAELKKANGSLNKFSKNAKKSAESAKRAFVGIAAALGANQLAGNIVRVSSEMETLRTSLTTVFGSAEKAALQFSRINDFASKTPFTIQDLTEATIRLKSVGLDPSVTSLQSLGNTASAMGKPLMQATEAIADAVTGEFERLKEFGIESKSEGDRVKFTFQGVTTEVGKNAAEIQEYLLGIGSTKFAGAVERQSQTLAGALSTLKGAADNLAVAFAEKTGLSKALKEAAKRMTEFFNRISSGRESVKQLEKDLEKLEKGPLKRSRITKSREKRQEEERTRLKQAKALRLEIERIKAEAGDIAAATNVINGLNAEMDTLQQSLTGGPLTTGKRDQFLTQEGRNVRRIDEIKAEIEAMESLKSIASQLLTDALPAAEKVDAVSRILGGNPEETMERLEESLMDEEGRMRRSYVNQQTILERARMDGLITEDKFKKLEFKLENKHLKSINDLREKKRKEDEAKERRDHARKIGAVGAFFGAMGAQSKKFAIAEAITNTYLGVTQSLAAYPMPWAAIMAATHLAAGLQAVNSIRSGGGSTPSAPSAPSVPGLEPGADSFIDQALQSDEEPERSVTKTVILNVEGASKELFRDFADQINELNESNVKIVI